MNTQNKEYLGFLIKEASILIDKKFSAGVSEHGGNLWDKKDLIDMAIAEAIDQVVYLLTLKEQIKNNNLGTTYDKR